MDNEKINKLKAILIKAEADPEKIKNEAKDFLKTIKSDDLILAEQELINEGIKPETLRHLCAAHIEVMNEQLDNSLKDLPIDHPIKTLMLEHEEILKFLASLEKTKNKKDLGPSDIKELKNIIHHILAAEKHHQREEEILFPVIEKKGFFGPPQIMRSEHTELRAMKKELANMLEKGLTSNDKDDFDRIANQLILVLRDHIFKENNILYPASLELIDDEKVWQEIKKGCDKIGYCCFTPKDIEKESKITLDLRPLPPFERHAKIFEIWENLKNGQTMKIINDHDPKPLYYQFQAEYSDQFRWLYLENGPKDWIVTIQKI